MTLRLGFRPEEVARLLGLSRDSVYRAIRAGDIPADRIAGCLIVPARALANRFGEAIDVEVDDAHAEEAIA